MESCPWIRKSMLHLRMSPSSVTLGLVWSVPRVSLAQRIPPGTQLCPHVTGSIAPHMSLSNLKNCASPKALIPASTGEI